MNQIPPDRSTAPALHSFGPLRLDDAATELLDNGVTLHSVTRPDDEVCRISVAIPGGDAETGPDCALRMVAPALLEGTVRHSGARLSELLEDYGAWSGTSLSVHSTVYTLNCLSSHLARLLPLVREVVLEPAFEEHAMTGMTERLAARNELDRCKVAWRAAEVLRPKVYGPGCPLAFSPTPDEIRAVTPRMLREAHYARLDPRGMHVFLAGGVDEEMMERVRETFSSIPDGCDFPLRPIAFAEPGPGTRCFTEMPDALQSGLTMSIPVIGRHHPDFIPLRMTVIALGGYFGSRLMTNIREEKGLTYGIGASLLGYREKGFVNIDTETATEYVADVEREIAYELERMKDPASYTADELSRLSFIVLSGLASALDTPLTRMDLIEGYTLAGVSEGYFAAQESLARNLSAELLASMARKYFSPDRIFTSIAGKHPERL